MKQLTGFTDMAGTEDIISRLDDRLESLKTQQKPVLYPEQDNLPNGRQYIPIIHQAIVEKSVLAIRYKSSREYEPRTYIISPYALREFRYRWFVFGQHSKSNTLVSFALDSILSIEVFNGATYHAIRELMSYGEGIIVHSPHSLVETIQKKYILASNDILPRKGKEKNAGFNKKSAFLFA